MLTAARSTTQLSRDLLKAMPERFTLGQMLEAAERRGYSTQDGFRAFVYLRALGEIHDTGHWVFKLPPRDCDAP